MFLSIFLDPQVDNSRFLTFISSVPKKKEEKLLSNFQSERLKLKFNLVKTLVVLNTGCIVESTGDLKK